MSYYLSSKVARSFKPYIHKDVKRDLHDPGTVSAKLSAGIRRFRRRRADA